MKIRPFAICITLFLLMISFQNCGKKSSGEPAGLEPGSSDTSGSQEVDLDKCFSDDVELTEEEEDACQDHEDASDDEGEDNSDSDSDDEDKDDEYDERDDESGDDDEYDRDEAAERTRERMREQMNAWRKRIEEFFRSLRNRRR